MSEDLEDYFDRKTFFIMYSGPNYVISIMHHQTRKEGQGGRLLGDGGDAGGVSEPHDGDDTGCICISMCKDFDGIFCTCKTYPSKENLHNPFEDEEVTSNSIDPASS